MGYVSAGRGEDRQQYEELPKESDGRKEKMDGTRDENTMITVCMRDGLYSRLIINYYMQPSTKCIPPTTALLMYKQQIV